MASPAPIDDLAATVRQSVPSVVTSVVDGRSVAPDDGERLSVVNPADGETLLELETADAATVNRAVTSARRTFAAGTWSRTSTARRQAVLRATADLIRANADRLAALDTLTTGLSFSRSTRGQAHAAAAWFDYFAGLLEAQAGQTFRQLESAVTVVTREPVGVAGLFTPWNIPLMGASLKMAAALSMGNSVVIKPSEQSPLGTIELIRLLHEAGLPVGVAQLVNGAGAITGAALAAHPAIDLVSFTGGEGAGRQIGKAAAERFAKVTMELGGKSANIVFADADLDKALDGALLAAFANNGQACLAGSRILVERSIAERFIADFVDRTQRLRIGQPFDPDTDMGPLAMRAQVQRLQQFVATVADEGGELLCGGTLAAECPSDCYVYPAVALAHNHAATICQQEVFGPLATFVIFDDEADAVRLANDTRFGLAGYVWTSNLERAWRVSQALRSGYVLINTPMARERNAPFGGFAHSGIDREGGRWSLDFYSEARTTVMHHGQVPIGEGDLP
ncbi:MAG: aldehyde dehydrogenase family protein [Pseudomonadota bacterium]